MGKRSDSQSLHSAVENDLGADGLPRAVWTLIGIHRVRHHRKGHMFTQQMGYSRHRGREKCVQDPGWKTAFRPRNFPGICEKDPHASSGAPQFSPQANMGNKQGQLSKTDANDLASKTHCTYESSEAART